MHFFILFFLTINSAFAAYDLDFGLKIDGEQELEEEDGKVNDERQNNNINNIENNNINNIEKDIEKEAIDNNINDINTINTSSKTNNADIKGKDLVGKNFAGGRENKYRFNEYIILHYIAVSFTLYNLQKVFPNEGIFKQNNGDGYRGTRDNDLFAVFKDNDSEDIQSFGTYSSYMRIKTYYNTSKQKNKNDKDHFDAFIEELAGKKCPSYVDFYNEQKDVVFETCKSILKDDDKPIFEDIVNNIFKYGREVEMYLFAICLNIYVYHNIKQYLDEHALKKNKVFLCKNKDDTQKHDREYIRLLSGMLCKLFKFALLALIYVYKKGFKNFLEMRRNFFLSNLPYDGGCIKEKPFVLFYTNLVFRPAKTSSGEQHFLDCFYPLIKTALKGKIL